MRTKWLLSLCLVVALLGVAACGGSDSGGDGEASAKKSSGQGQEPGAAPQPDLDGIPDVVAVVNGREVSKEKFIRAYEGQFQQLALQSQQSGQELDQEKLKTQVAESLVGAELLIQEADKRDFTASEAEVDKTLTELTAQNGLKSKDEFMAAMKKQGLNKDEVMSELATQVKVDELIADEAGDIEPTNKELKQLYDQAVAQQEQSGQGGEGSKVPPFKKVKPQLEEQAKSQKESKVAGALIGDLRKDADVTVNL